MTETPRTAISASGKTNPGRTGLACIILAAATLGTFCLATGFGVLHAGRAVAQALVHLRKFGAAGWLIFVLLQTGIALVGFLPASLLGLAAGAIYGIALGFGLSATGVALGAALAFLLARSALRPGIARTMDRNPKLRRLDAAITRDGWRLVLLMRVSPLMPFSLTSFALGLSGIAFRPYMLGTLASLPALLLYVVLGALGAHSLSLIGHDGDTTKLTLLAAGLVATALLTLRLGWLIRRSLGPEVK